MFPQNKPKGLPTRLSTRQQRCSPKVKEYFEGKYVAYVKAA